MRKILKFSEITAFINLLNQYELRRGSCCSTKKKGDGEDQLYFKEKK